MDNSLKGFYRMQLNRIIKKNNPEYIIIHPPLIDWRTPLFQRPQQIALAISELGCLFFYCTFNHNDKVHGFVKIRENCYLTNCYDLLLKIKIKKVFDCYSTDNNMQYDIVKQQLEEGNIILYQYIDDLDEAIKGKIPEYTFIKHQYILKNEDCIVVATAEKLLGEVKISRKKNYAYVSNGVDYNHFSKTRENGLPEKIKKIVENKKPILGYYGALASWIDHELIIRISFLNRYEILLIGYDYDGTFSKRFPESSGNIHILGPVNYQDLPDYAKYFSICIIPFLVNDLTNATSPIKLFEYMALGKPILTTDIAECRKYRSAIVARDHDDFIRKIDYSLSLAHDHDYLAILRDEAIQNSWTEKARQIKLLVESNLDFKPASSIQHKENV